MNRFLVPIAVLAACGTGVAADLKSGLQVGEAAGYFEVHDVTVLPGLPIGESADALGEASVALASAEGESTMIKSGCALILETLDRVTNEIVSESAAAADEFRGAQVPLWATDR